MGRVSTTPLALCFALSLATHAVASDRTAQAPPSAAPRASSETAPAEPTGGGEPWRPSRMAQAVLPDLGGPGHGHLPRLAGAAVPLVILSGLAVYAAGLVLALVIVGVTCGAACLDRAGRPSRRAADRRQTTRSARDRRAAAP